MRPPCLHLLLSVMSRQMRQVRVEVADAADLSQRRQWRGAIGGAHVERMPAALLVKTLREQQSGLLFVGGRDHDRQRQSGSLVYERARAAQDGDRVRTGAAFEPPDHAPVP